LLPGCMFGCALFGALATGRDARMGWTLLALSLAAFVVWLVALLRVAAIAHAPLWTAPLHFVGAWLTAELLSEAARDLRARTPTRWGGRDYDLGTGKP